MLMIRKASDNLIVEYSYVFIKDSMPYLLHQQTI